MSVALGQKSNLNPDPIKKWRGSPNAYRDLYKKAFVVLIVPYLRTTPVLPIRLARSESYTMFDDLQSYDWVLNVYEYKDEESLISELPTVIDPAEMKAQELRK